MNYIESREKLKDISDNDVVNYYHNPTPDVPMFLALSELQRRKRLRDSYQANKPEDKTVAEDLVQEAQPQPGIMGLPEGQPMQQAMQPPPEMPMEQMAQGGLAELDTGNMYDENNYANGGIVAFAGREGSYVQSDDPYGDMYSSDLERAIALKQYELDKKKRLQDKTFPGFLSTPPTKPEQFDINALAAKVGKGGYDSKLESPSLTDAELAIKKSIEDAKKNPFTDKNVFSAFTAPVEKIGSIKGYADELKDYIGEDPMRQKLADRLAKMETRATKMEEQAPWLALAKAGFEMASARPEYGKGQSALADIARGAGVGIKDYVESRDKLNTLEEKRFNIENDLAKANRAEQMAVAKYGADSKQAAEARAHADRLHNSSIKTQFKIAELNASINSTNRMAAIRDKIDDNVRAKIKQVYGEGALSPEEYDKHFKRFLSEEYAKYGLSGAPAVTESMPGNMVFDPKTKEYTYKPKS